MNKQFLIISQKGDNIFNYEYVWRVHASDDRVHVYSNTGADVWAGLYDTDEQARYAVEMMTAAMLNNEESFQFPHRKDVEIMMNIAHQHRSKVESRKRSHGGS